MKVIFFGTPVFAAKVLEYLLQQGIDVVAVITKPDRPKGRSGAAVLTPVKLVAMAHNPPLPLFQPPLVSAPEFALTLPPFQADLFIVVAYGEIIKQHLLEMPHLGCINLHASLLPKYRGAAPIQQSIMQGELSTGVTIIHMAKKMDAGDIIKMVEVPIEANATFPEVEHSLCEEGAKLLLAVIRDFEKGVVARIPQEHSQATFAAKIELEDCELDWTLPAQQLHNLVRAVTPHPGAWCYALLRDEKRRIKVHSTRVVREMSGTPGEIIAYGKEGLLVACGEGALRLLEVQVEGKKSMTAEELMRGIAREHLSFFFSTQ